MVSNDSRISADRRQIHQAVDTKKSNWSVPDLQKKTPKKIHE